MIILTENLKKNCRSAFISDRFDYYKSTRLAVQYLSSSDGSEMELNTFICSFVVMRNSFKAEDIRWEAAGSLPFPWRVGQAANTKLTIAPNGRLFLSRRTAQDFIEASEDILQEEKSILLSAIAKTSILNSVDTKTDYFENVDDKKTIPALHKTAEYFENDEKKDIPALHKTAKRISSHSIPGHEAPVWKGGHPTVPADWMVARDGDGNRILRSPVERIFSDRTNALRSLAEDPNCPKADIETMKAGLVEEEGWTR